ncbi:MULTISPECIES: VOC family protein [Pontibacillus]|uniref:VOC family protein n=1 Tax=Pontibacillus chungwhensis TaxID=265426 RepID=A0ABY8UVK6_9BACI|nr:MULTISPECIES: VOC family protein [Pontibacillus]MCD5325120.1 VOC family protein [Pontibacillus sp. HN14]WIF97370.1 VOC family protein [Pontibacillus chungwhensis]
MNICKINIYVSDLDFAIQWYSEVLDLKRSDDHDNYPTCIDLIHDRNIRLTLHKTERDTEIEIWKEASTIITFEVENIRATMKDLKERGVRFYNEEPVWFPDGERIAFNDPFGNVHELAEVKKQGNETMEC